MPAHEVVVGIDPGLKGALVVLETATGNLLDKLPMPDEILTTYRWLHSHKNTFPTMIIALEKPLVIKGKSSLVGSFGMGKNYGALYASIRLLYVQLQIIPPQSWTAELHKGADGDGPKAKSLCVAKNLWPWEKFTYTEKQVKAQDGLVDAMLIAEYLRRRIK